MLTFLFIDTTINLLQKKQFDKRGEKWTIIIQKKFQKTKWGLCQ